jgi:hypothetical protein
MKLMSDEGENSDPESLPPLSSDRGGFECGAVSAAVVKVGVASAGNMSVRNLRHQLFCGCQYIRVIASRRLSNMGCEVPREVACMRICAPRRAYV